MDIFHIVCKVEKTKNEIFFNVNIKKYGVKETDKNYCFIGKRLPKSDINKIFQSRETFGFIAETYCFAPDVDKMKEKCIMVTKETTQKTLDAICEMMNFMNSKGPKEKFKDYTSTIINP